MTKRAMITALEQHFFNKGYHTMELDWKWPNKQQAIITAIRVKNDPIVLYVNSFRLDIYDYKDLKRIYTSVGVGK